MKPARGRAAAIVCFFVFPVLSLGSPMAAENDCDALLKSLSGSGEVPAVVINPADETVLIATTKGICSESIEAWSKREPLSAGKTPAKKPSKKKPKPTAPPTVVVKPVPVEKPALAPQPEPPTVVVKPVPIEKPAPAPAPKPKPASKPALQPVVPTASPGPVLPLKSPPLSRRCDYRLKEVWASQVLVIEGIKHWLSRAFTLDLDSDHTVDNVSFTFVAKGDTERIIHYFGAAGELSGWSYPALKLPNESVIKRLCFDDVTYEKPKFFEAAPLKPKWIEIDKPDLAGEMDAKEKGIVYKKKTKKKKKKKPEEESMAWWIWALIGAGVLAGAGGLWAVLGGKGGDDEDEEDDGEKDDKGFDDDEDEDGGKKKKSKFSLGALFKRSKKKGKGDDEDEEDDGDEEDEDDEDGGKKKKSKFSLGALFKRSKKKGKGDDEDDDENGLEDEDDDKMKKKKKSKFSLGGLFKRSKKKKKDDEDDEEE